MAAAVISALIGALCIYLGIRNMKGDISSLHSYHRKNVKEEDVIPFGKAVGIGTVIIGASVTVFSFFTGASIMTENDIFSLIGTGILIAGIVIGCIITFGAMIKYNKGIF